MLMMLKHFSDHLFYFCSTCMDICGRNKIIGFWNALFICDPHIVNRYAYCKPIVEILDFQYHMLVYTLWTIKGGSTLSDHNSGKSWSIFIICILHCCKQKETFYTYDKWKLPMDGGGGYQCEFPVYRKVLAVRMKFEVIELVGLETGREQVKFAVFRNGLVFPGN